MNKLTILTPSYNRASILPNLYESLKKQTCRDFEWLVVDDGSSDETADLIREWVEEAVIAIRSLEKENGGKHTALNAGISKIGTELTFIVDSDDWLPENAVETILRYHEKYRNREGLCGYSFLRFYPDGRVNEAFFPEGEKIDTYVNVRINGGIGGDKAEVFYTSVLKDYPFPVFEGEKFLPEDEVWVRMSGPFKMVHINECVYISDYLEGGLTKSGRRMKLRSPLGMMARSRAYLADPAVKMKVKIKMLLLYQIYGRRAEIGFLEQRGVLKQRLLFALLWIPSGCLYLRWSRKYECD